MFAEHLRQEGLPYILTVPGLNSSGPGHWQTMWETRRNDCGRADLGMWHAPRRNAWVTKLNQAIRNAPRPLVICAHSLGCLAVAWWAVLEGQVGDEPVAGAMLVAPPDCERDDASGSIGGFGSMPRRLLPFPSVLVASRNDAYASIEASRAMARSWGSEFVDIGNAGHINAESNLGHWPTGEAILEALIDQVLARGERRMQASRIPPPQGDASGTWVERYA